MSGEKPVRPPAIQPDKLNPRQRAVYDEILAGPRGVVQGPLMVWLHSPDLAHHAQELGAFCRYGTSLTPDLSELAISVMGSFWKAGYEWFIHTPIAEKAGVPAAALEAIKNGETPDLTGAQKAVYDFSIALLTRHEVDDATYEAAFAELGQQGVIDLVGILGYYGLISMTIKAFRVPVPKGAEEPF